MKTFSSKEKKHLPVRTRFGLRRTAYCADGRRQTGAVRQILGHPRLQGKLTVGGPNDAYEQEADRVADEVMAMPETGVIQRRCAPCQGNKIQTKPVYKTITRILQRQRIQRQSWPSFDLSSENEEESIIARKSSEAKPIQKTPDIQRRAESVFDEIPEEEKEEPIMAKSDASWFDIASSSLKNRIHQSRGQGTPLPNNTLSFMGKRFGVNFNQVRIHSDSNAIQLNRQLNAQAFTKGTDIYFNSGKYNPYSMQGKHLLAHELTHVIQQSGLSTLQKQDNNYIQRTADLSKAPSGLPCALKPGVGHSPGVGILFSVGKSTISAEDKLKLDTFAASWIASGMSDTVFIDGFASTDGAQSTNWRLSCKRAMAVKKYLKEKHVSGSKIIVIAHGETTEFSTSDEKENRRVVVSRLSTPTPPAIPPAVPPQPTPLLLKNIKFASDHGMLKDNNTIWSNSGFIVEPEWVTNPLRNKAISHTRNTRLVADVTVNVGPPGTSFDLIGTGINSNDTSFKKTGITSTGTDQVISITADNNLPNAVSQLYRYIVWKIKTGNREQIIGFSGSHRIYVTYDTPVGGVTEKRMEWCCQKADAQNTPETIADKIQSGVSSDTSFGAGGVDGWNLMVGGSGDCDNQARLMSYAVGLLGVTPATVKLVRASTNGGAGNCLDLESRWWFGTQYLIMDFIVGPGHDWNAYEGVCNTAGFYYAITPRIKATDDYDMLRKLTCTQYWVKSPVPPGSSGWGVTSVHGIVPKP